MMIKQEKDDTGCTHFLDGDTRKENGWEMGLCASCKNQVGFKLNKQGRRTGETIIIRFVSE
jgi:hypothetical protein